MDASNPNQNPYNEKPTESGGKPSFDPVGFLLKNAFPQIYKYIDDRDRLNRREMDKLSRKADALDRQSDSLKRQSEISNNALKESMDAALRKVRRDADARVKKAEEDAAKTLATQKKESEQKYKTAMAELEAARAKVLSGERKTTSDIELKKLDVEQRKRLVREEITAILDMLKNAKAAARDRGDVGKVALSATTKDRLGSLLRSKASLNKEHSDIKTDKENHIKDKERSRQVNREAVKELTDSFPSIKKQIADLFEASQKAIKNIKAETEKEVAAIHAKAKAGSGNLEKNAPSIIAAIGEENRHVRGVNSALNRLLSIFQKSEKLAEGKAGLAADAQAIAGGKTGSGLIHTLMSGGVKAVIGEALIAYAPYIAGAAAIVAGLVMGSAAMKAGVDSILRDRDRKSGKDGNQVDRAERLREAKSEGDAAKVNQIQAEEKNYQAFKDSGFQSPMGTPEEQHFEGGVKGSDSTRVRGGGGGGADGSPVGGGGGSNVPGVKSKGKLVDNQREAYQAARDSGLDDKSAKALVANMSGEGLGNPSAYNKDYNSRGQFVHMAQGIVQWDPTRSARIAKEFGKEPRFMSVAEQTKAAIWEAKTYPNEFPGVYSTLTDPNATSEQKINALVRHYEKSAHQDTDVNKRIGIMNGLGDLSKNKTDVAGGSGGGDGSIPTSVLEGAKNILAKGGNSQEVQNFMAKNGHPKSGAWCGEFTASLLESQGMPVPKNPQVASNWKNYGEHVDPKDIRPGDIAVKKRSRFNGSIVRPGDTGSHVGVVYGGIDHRTGHFKMVGGNQGKPVAGRNMDDYEIRRYVPPRKEQNAASPVGRAEVRSLEPKEYRDEPRRFDPKSYASDPRMQDTNSKNKPYVLSTMPDRVPRTSIPDGTWGDGWDHERLQKELGKGGKNDATPVDTGPGRGEMYPGDNAPNDAKLGGGDGRSWVPGSDAGPGHWADQNPTSGADLNAASTNQKISEGAKPSSASSNIVHSNTEHHDKKKTDPLLKVSNVAAADDHLKKMFSGYGSFA